jgi:hypothetical protein
MTSDVGKLLRTTRHGAPCKIEGPIINETPRLLMVQVDYSGDRGGYVGPMRFRKASVGTYSRWSGAITHTEPCPHCPDYSDTESNSSAPGEPP